MIRVKLMVLFIIIGCGIAKSQFLEHNSIYYSSALSIGNYCGITADLNYTYKDKYAAVLGINVLFRRAKSEPEDYSPGIFNTLFFFDLDQPRDKIVDFNLSVGRILALNDSKTIKLNFTAGLGIMFTQEPANWRKLLENESMFNFVNSYSWKEEKRLMPSFVVKPKLELHVCRFFGIYLAPELQIGTRRTYLGISLGYMLGVLHPEYNRVAYR